MLTSAKPLCSTMPETVENLMVIEIEHEPEICVLRLAGRFRSGEDPSYVQAKEDEIRRHECKSMLADLRELEVIGSMGMGFITGLYVTITKRSGDGRFVVTGANQRVRAVFDLTALSTVIPFAADVPSGLAALRGRK